MDRRAGLLGLTAAIAALLLLIAVLAYQTWWRFNPALDLNIYLEASRALWRGENPYAIATPAPFIYPLFVCIILWPLAQVPLEAAAVVWFVLSLLALAAAFAMVLRISGPMDAARAVGASAIVCVLLTEVLQNNLRNGQINFMVLGCTVAFAWYWSRGRRGLASCWLAVAIAMKITPGIFLIWLARRRDWRTLVATSAMTLVLTIGLPAAVAGPRVVDDFRGYVQTFVGGRVASAPGVIVDRRPFSVVGVLHRFTDVSFPFDAAVLGLGVVLITGLFVDRRSNATGQGTAALVCLYLVAVLLVTPMSEIHHLALVLPGLVWLTYRALAGQLTPGRIAVLVFVIAAIMLRRSFHAALFAGVAGAWALLAAEIHSIEKFEVRSSKFEVRD